MQEKYLERLKDFYGIVFMYPYRQIAEETDVSDSSDAEDKEGLGDKIFSLVEELDPLYANDITGELTQTKNTESSVNEGVRFLTCVCAQGCCWRWTRRLCDSSSVTAKCWMLLFGKHKQLSTITSELRTGE